MLFRSRIIALHKMDSKFVGAFDAALIRLAEGQAEILCLRWTDDCGGIKLRLRGKPDRFFGFAVLRKYKFFLERGVMTGLILAKRIAGAVQLASISHGLMTGADN